MRHRPHHPRRAAVDHPAAGAEGEAEELQIWAVAALVNRLGLVVVVTPGGASLGAINEVGGASTDMAVERLGDAPGRRGEMPGVAYGVVERIVGEVRRRGVALKHQQRSTATASSG